MLGRFLTTAALVAVLSSCAAPPQEVGKTADGPMNTPTVGEIVSFLASQGQRAKLEANDAGDPQLIVNKHGDNFLVAFYDCNADGALASRRCTGLEFSVSYPVKKKLSLSQIDRFNRDYHMVKAYMNDEGNPGLSLAMNIGGAFNRDHLVDSLDWWFAAMRQYEKDIGWS
jgi:hypothetical protein